MLLGDPLREVTRVERRNLLIVSVIGVVVAKAQVVPQKIPALGVEFGPIEMATFIWVMTAVVIYHIIGFGIYATADFLASKVDRESYLLELHGEGMRASERITRSPLVTADVARLLRQTAEASGSVEVKWFIVGFVRTLFEFAVPLVIGVYATFALIDLKAAYNKQHGGSNKSAAVSSVPPQPVTKP